MGWQLAGTVAVVIDPITGLDLDEPQDYYKVEVTWPPSDQVYVYLVPSDRDGNPPTHKEINAAMKEYSKNREDKPRNWKDYVVRGTKKQ